MKKYITAVVLLVVILISGVFVFNNFISPEISELVYNGNLQLASVSGSGSELVAHYKFDEGSGTMAGDSAGSNTGTLVNGPAWVSGKSGTGLSLDGSNDMVTTATDPIGTGPASISLWIYPRGLGQVTASIINNGKAVMSFGYNNRISFCSNGVTCPSNANFATPFNQWSHVVVTRDASGITNFYINGSPSGTANQNSGTPAATSGNFRIGNTQNGVHTFDGIIDEVRIYKRVLNASEIGELYTANSSGTPVDPPLASTQNNPLPVIDVSSAVTAVNGVYTVSAAGGTNTFKTIKECTEVVKAGETCRVQRGNYDERVVIKSSGTSGNPIIFEGTDGAKVRGFTMISQSHVIIRKFEVTHSGMSPDSTNAIQISGTTGVQILDNYIHHTNTGGIGFGDSSFLTIRGNTMSYIGMSVYAGGGGAALQGLYNRPNSDVLIEQNKISYVSDYLNPIGTRYVYRNNTLGPIDPTNTLHIDGVQPNQKTTLGLIEGNTFVNNNNSDNHVYLNQLEDADDWIIRFNTTLRSNGFFDWKNSDNHSLYNNTFYDNYLYYSTHSQIFLSNSTGNIARNNIWYRSVGPAAYENPYLVGTGSSVDKDYDLWFGSGGPAEVHAINADPLLVNPGAGNFQLNSNSPAIDRGGPLTAALNGGSQSTSLQVKSAGPFQDGWAGVLPDTISVGTPGNAAQISRIDRSANIITLSSPLSWKAGDPVYLYKNSTGRQVLYGNAPDIGAYEYSGIATSELPVSVTNPAVESSDTTPPSITLTKPLTGQTWTTGRLGLIADATDNVGVVGVTFYINGQKLGSEKTSVPYTINWKATVGTYTITAKARDAKGNTAISQPVIVTIIQKTR